MRGGGRGVKGACSGRKLDGFVGFEAERVDFGLLDLDGLAGYSVNVLFWGTGENG